MYTKEYILLFLFFTLTNCKAATKTVKKRCSCCSNTKISGNPCCCQKRNSKSNETTNSNNQRDNKNKEIKPVVKTDNLQNDEQQNKEIPAEQEEINNNQENLNILVQNPEINNPIMKNIEYNNANDEENNENQEIIEENVENNANKEENNEDEKENNENEEKKDENIEDNNANDEENNENQEIIEENVDNNANKEENNEDEEIIEENVENNENEEERLKKEEEEERLKKEEEERLKKEEEERLKKEEEERLKKQEEERLKKQEEERLKKEEEERLKKEEEERLKKEEVEKASLTSTINDTLKIFNINKNYTTYKSVKELLQDLRKNQKKDILKGIIDKALTTLSEKMVETATNKISQHPNKYTQGKQIEAEGLINILEVYYNIIKENMSGKKYNGFCVNDRNALDVGGVEGQVKDMLFTFIKKTNYNFLYENKYQNNDSCGYYSANLCVPNFVEYLFYKSLGALIAMNAVNKLKSNIKLPLIIYKLILEDYKNITKEDLEKVGICFNDEYNPDTIQINVSTDSLENNVSIKNIFKNGKKTDNNFFENLKNLIRNFDFYIKNNIYDDNTCDIIQICFSDKITEISTNNELLKINKITKLALNMKNKAFENNNNSSINNFKNDKEISSKADDLTALLTKLQFLDVGRKLDGIEHQINDYRKKIKDKIYVADEDDLKNIEKVVQLITEIRESNKVEAFNAYLEFQKNLNENYDNNESFNKNAEINNKKYDELLKLKGKDTIISEEGDINFINICINYLRGKGIKEEILSYSKAVEYIVSQLTFCEAIRSSIKDINSDILKYFAICPEILKDVVESTQEIDLDDMKNNIEIYCNTCRKIYNGYQEITASDCNNKMLVKLIFNKLEELKKTDKNFQHKMQNLLFNVGASSLLPNGGFSKLENKFKINFYLPHYDIFGKDKEMIWFRLHTCFNTMDVMKTEDKIEEYKEETFKEQFYKDLVEKKDTTFNIA